MGSITCEVLAAQFTGRQQEHDSLVEEGKANTLFFLKVVYIFLELFLVRVALRHKCNHSKHKRRELEIYLLLNLPLTLKFLDVLKVGPQGHIQVVEAIRQIEFIVVARDCVGHHAHSELFVSGHETTPDASLVIVEKVHRLCSYDFVR